MKHTHRLTLLRIFKIVLGGLIVVGSTSFSSQAFAAPQVYQNQNVVTSVSLPPAEATGRRGVGSGDTCLNIRGKDIDGETFQLSDYAGKVVLLDFWGDW